MIEPLDLRAVEASHQKTMNGFSSDPGAYVESAANVSALLAHCRALRATVEEWTSYHNSINVPDGCSCKMCQCARIVLARAQDGTA